MTEMTATQAELLEEALVAEHEAPLDGTYFKELERANLGMAQAEGPGYLVLRLDGRGFSKFTKQMQQPFDPRFSQAMIAGARQLAHEGLGACLIYTQSDEVSLVIPLKAPLEEDSGRLNRAPFGGKVPKLLTLSASAIAVSFFSSLKEQEVAFTGIPTFDGRVCGVMDEREVGDYLHWRRTDARKNSISMLAHHRFGTAKLKGLKLEERLQLLEEAGTPWADTVYLEARCGVFLTAETREEVVTWTDRRSGTVHRGTAPRTTWVAQSAEGAEFWHWTDLLEKSPEVS